MSEQICGLAKSLNETLQANGSHLADFLSERGRRAYFPSKGILGQSAAAKSAEINATIGTARDEQGGPLCLECLTRLMNIPSSGFLYAPSWGLPGLRETWRKMMLQKNPSLANASFSLPVVTHALTHGLYIAGQLFIEAGDEVITPDLYWDNYELLFSEACGSKFRTYPMFQGEAFNVRGLANCLAEPGSRKIVLLNFPNNPTGYTATEADADGIVDSLLRAARAGKRVTVILDDAYFGLVYRKGVCTQSLFTALANLHENILAVKLDGATKEDYVWGLRVGFITFGCKGATAEQYRALESKAAGMVRGTISSASNIGQKMLLEAFGSPDYAAQKKANYELLRARYERINEILGGHPEYRESFEPMPFNSGYFMCVRVKGADPEEVRLVLLSDYSTGVIVLSGLIRLAFSSVPLAKLEELFANIHSAVKSLRA